MADIFHDLPIPAPAKAVFQAISTPQGLDAWWTLRCSGRPSLGAEYELYFGPQYAWRAVVSRYTPESEFELQLRTADDDWRGTRVGFSISEIEGTTQLRFHHAGWPHMNEHYRISCFCWAMYLRLLKRYVLTGETVPYDLRLEV